MTKLNRKVEYSLMALKHMSLKRNGELTTAKEVSDSYQAPFDATARMLQIMAQNGILKSEQGASGGYQLVQDLGKVTLGDLMEMIQGPTQIAKCLQPGESACEIEKSCNIVGSVTSLNSKLDQFYKNLSIKDLMDEPRTRSIE